MYVVHDAGRHRNVTKISAGKLWFLPYDGVNVLDPRHLPINNLPPPVHIEQITADRKTYWHNWSADASSSRSSSSQPGLPTLTSANLSHLMSDDRKHPFLCAKDLEIPTRLSQ